jgi:hypothetical protein
MHDSGLGRMHERRLASSLQFAGSFHAPYSALSHVCPLPSQPPALTQLILTTLNLFPRFESGFGSFKDNYTFLRKKNVSCLASAIGIGINDGWSRRRAP